MVADLDTAGSFLVVLISVHQSACFLILSFDMYINPSEVQVFSFTFLPINYCTFFRSSPSSTSKQIHSLPVSSRLIVNTSAFHAPQSSPNLTQRQRPRFYSLPRVHQYI